jgi:hypothetical protein
MGKKVLVSGVVVTFVVLIIYIFVRAVWSMSGGVSYAPSMMSNTYQAVFLNNGQVYFGHLSMQNSQFPELRSVYYLQVTQPPQPLKPGETPPTNINLVKLGGELHGPTDEMRIKKDSILFVEDLRADSRVVQAINQLAGKK